MNYKYQGTIVDVRASFGFIWCPELHRRVFYHAANVLAEKLSVSEKVEFELGPGKDGHPDQALFVTPVTVVTPEVALTPVATKAVS